jgi:hypothetical protein
VPTRTGLNWLPSRFRMPTKSLTHRRPALANSLKLPLSGFLTARFILSPPT